jgi:epoxyqueuosine reductase
MEKALAQRAGIGWIGKNANLITKDIGSWVFLGEIISTLDLVVDEPATDHCGTCTLCIEACPTGAIVEPAVVDSHRCISYLTIEHRGPIPSELRGRMEHWIYGCDVCQDVCPWNEKFSTPADLAAFAPRAGNAAPYLTEIMTMTEQEFSRRFRGSAVKRTKLSGLQRNVADALVTERDATKTAGSATRGNDRT